MNEGKDNMALERRQPLGMYDAEVPLLKLLMQRTNCTTAGSSALPSSQRIMQDSADGGPSRGVIAQPAPLQEVGFVHFRGVVHPCFYLDKSWTERYKFGGNFNR